MGILARESSLPKVSLKLSGRHDEELGRDMGMVVAEETRILLEVVACVRPSHSLLKQAGE